jgi:hypothetical protein
MADLIKVCQEVAQVEYGDPPLLKVSQVVAQAEFSDPPLLKVFQEVAQVEYIFGCGPSGIGSSESFGTPELSVTVNEVDPTGISSGEAFGTAALVMYLLPSGISSGEAVGSPRMGVPLYPSAIDSGEGLGSPEITQNISVEPLAIDSEEAIGSPALALSVFPNGISSSESLGTATLTLFVKPGAVSPAGEFGIPEILVGFATVAPASIDSQEGFGEAEFTPGPVNVLPVSIETGEDVDTPALYPYVVLAMGGVTSEESFGSPQLNQNVKPAGIVSEQDFGSPQLNLIINNFYYYYYPWSNVKQRKVDGIPINYRLVPLTGPYFKTAKYYPSDFVSTHNVITQAGGPQIISEVMIDPLYDDTGEPTVIPGRVDAFPSGVPSGEALGGAEVIPGPVTVEPTAIAATLSIGSPSLVLFVLTGAIDSDEIVAEPLVVPGPVWLYPAGIEGYAFGRVTVYSPKVLAGLIVIEDLALATLEFTDGQEEIVLYDDSPERMVING